MTVQPLLTRFARSFHNVHFNVIISHFYYSPTVCMEFDYYSFVERTTPQAALRMRSYIAGGAKSSGESTEPSGSPWRNRLVRALPPPLSSIIYFSIGFAAIESSYDSKQHQSIAIGTIVPHSVKRSLKAVQHQICLFTSLVIVPYSLRQIC